MSRGMGYNRWIVGRVYTCILFGAGYVLTGFGGDALAAYDSNDLAGTWYIDSLTRHDPNASRWWFGPITVEPNGFYRGTVRTRFQTEANVMRDYR